MREMRGERRETEPPRSVIPSVARNPLSREVIPSAARDLFGGPRFLACARNDDVGRSVSRLSPLVSHALSLATPMQRVSSRSWASLLSGEVQCPDRAFTETLLPAPPAGLPAVERTTRCSGGTRSGR